MKNFIITSAVCIAMILSSASSMAQQITIVSGKVLNLPEGEKKPRPFPMGETVRIFAFNTVASARDALKALETAEHCSSTPMPWRAPTDTMKYV